MTGIRTHTLLLTTPELGLGEPRPFGHDTPGGGETKKLETYHKVDVEGVPDFDWLFYLVWDR